MGLGAMKSGAMFVTAFAAMFAAMSVNAPAAKSQVGLLQRMTFMHQNAQLHFSNVDPAQAPSPAASEVVGKFIFATAQSSNLVEGHPYPHHINPDYLYGITKDGSTIRRVGPTGSALDTISFGNMFTRVTGAFLVTNQVAFNPQYQTRAYDLKEHFILVGEVNQGNPSLIGNTTGMMLVNPKTMAGYKVGNAPMFLGPSGGRMFEDVAFGVYPGPDADYSTTGDNEYRYVVFMSQDQGQTHDIYCLSLTEHESMNGIDPPSPWNPVPQERGPDYTNVYPAIDANPNGDFAPPITAVDNGQMYLRAYYARPELAAIGFPAPTDVTYIVAGFVVEIPGIPIQWSCRVQAFTLGTDAPIVAMAVPRAASANFQTDDIFKGMTVIGDWLICSVGDGNNGDGFADTFSSMYLPVIVSGGAGFASTQGGGWAGFHVNQSGHPVISYGGSGPGSSIARGTTRDPFLFHPEGLFFDMTNIDMHTEEEKLLGISIRRAPQPFVGFWFSEDPATNFPGFRDGEGGGDGSGGCSGSTGGGAGASLGMLGLLGMGFLVTQVLKVRRS